MSTDKIRDLEPLLVHGIRRDMERNPSGRGGEVHFHPSTKGYGKSGCPGDNIVAGWDELAARARLADELAAELTDVRDQLAAKDELLTLRTAALDRVSATAERLQRQVWDADERDLTEREADSNALETARERVAALEAEVERLRADVSHRSSVTLHQQRRAESAEAALTFTKGNLADVARDCEAAEARLDAVRAQHTGRHGCGTGLWNRAGSCPIIRALDSDATASEPTCGHPNHGGWDHACAPFTTSSEPTVERITDDRGDELERGADTDAEADQPQPTNETSECHCPEDCPRCDTGHGPWLCDDCLYYLASDGYGGSFITHRQGVDRTDTPGGQR